MSSSRVIVALAAARLAWSPGARADNTPAPASAPAASAPAAAEIALDQLQDLWQALLSDAGWPRIPHRDEV